MALTQEDLLKIAEYDRKLYLAFEKALKKERLDVFLKKLALQAVRLAQYQQKQKEKDKNAASEKPAVLVEEREMLLL